MSESELKDDVKTQFIKTEDRWDALVEEDEFKDDNEREKWEGEKIRPTSSTGAPQPASPSGPPKIVDTLKPKEPLSEEMNLEEADQWFKSYRAHLAYNKGTLDKQEIQVLGAMLEVDLDPRMPSALRSHDKIKDNTNIDAKCMLYNYFYFAEVSSVEQSTLLSPILIQGKF